LAAADSLRSFRTIHLATRAFVDNADAERALVLSLVDALDAGFRRRDIALTAS
jgi:hypothetical protein